VSIDGEIICEKPNNVIYKFEGMANVKQIQNSVPLNAENLLLRGSSLKNTTYIYGISIFTGHDTKVMLNNAPAKYKFSSLEKLTNHAILIIVAL
jgi:magnesium-transporting ATPase (P-type)